MTTVEKAPVVAPVEVKTPEPVLGVVERLEAGVDTRPPSHVVVPMDTGTVLASIAISLKRIADQMKFK
jgi:hypothetical protein